MEINILKNYPNKQLISDYALNKILIIDNEKVSYR